MSRRVSRSLLVLLALSLIAPDRLSAQESRDPRRAGPRALLLESREIALARSAAPAAVSDSATVYVFTDTGYVMAERGSSGAACYVSRSWPTSVEPHCFDSEGASTIMLMHMHEVLLLHRGATPAEAERAVMREVATGRFRLPRQPAVSYMMSEAQQLIADDGRPVGRWQPHIMIYHPRLSSAAGGSVRPDEGTAFVSGAGTPTSSIIVVMTEFVPVREPVVGSR